jgi:cell wall-associated NlpC family hydrolase
MRAPVSALSAATTGTGAAVRPLRAVPAPELSTTPADPSASGTTAPAAPSGGSGELTTTPLTSVPVAPSSGGTSSAASGSVDALIAAAKSRIGAPYVYGATGPDAFDCSGFTAWAYGQIGVALPRTAQEQWQSAGTQISYSAARPGDLLAWAGDPSTPGYVTHVAIYLGDGQMIAAPHSGSTVGVQPVYSSGVLGAVRVLR